MIGPTWIPLLIDQVVRTAELPAAEARRAIEELAALGAPAVAPVLAAMDGPFPRGVHQGGMGSDLVFGFSARKTKNKVRPYEDSEERVEVEGLIGQRRKAMLLR